MESGMDMVEIVARAICLTQWGGYPVERQEREAWPQWTEARKMARAAIEAMRDPTRPMLDAVYAEERKAWSKGIRDDTMDVESAWPLMIDAALKQNEETGK